MIFDIWKYDIGYNGPVRPPTFSSETIADFLRRETVATLPQLSAALGNASVSTVARKLKSLGYISSYSHRRRFYALRESAQFDSLGLWSHHQIRFSSHGTLRATAQALVDSSQLGFRPAELDDLLGVRTIDTLSLLVRKEQLARVRSRGRSLYCSADPVRQQRQVDARRIRRTDPTTLPAPPDPVRTNTGLAAAIALFCSVLDEKQRRLFAGLASLLCGRGGDRRTAALLGLHRKTVAKGRRQLATGDVEPDRVRKKGGGRKSLQKKRVLYT